MEVDFRIVMPRDIPGLKGLPRPIRQNNARVSFSDLSSDHVSRSLPQPQWCRLSPDLAVCPSGNDLFDETVAYQAIHD
jgi:hypothetical protein